MANFGNNVFSSSANQNDDGSYNPEIHYQVGLDADFALRTEKGQERVLYVGNLDKAVTEELIVGMFGQNSKIVKVKVFSNTSSPVFAFVEFENHYAALQAMLHNHEFLDLGIKVEWVSPLPDVDTGSSFEVFVGQLSPDIDSNALRTAFLPFGRVLGAKVIYEQGTFISRGFGFVSYSTFEAAQSAINLMSKQVLGNRPIITNWATRKLNNSPTLKIVQPTQAINYDPTLELKYNEQINMMNQALATKNCENANLKDELQKKENELIEVQKKHESLKKMYDKVYADANRFYQERAKLRNDLKEKTLSFENLEKHLNSQKTENFELQLEIYKLKLQQAQPSNSTVTSDVSIQSQLHSSNGGQASNASSTSQKSQKRPFPMPIQVKREIIEEIDQKAATCSNQPSTKSLQNENQSLVMNQVSAVNASNKVNGQEEKKVLNTFNLRKVKVEPTHDQLPQPSSSVSQIPNLLDTDFKTIFSGSNSSLVEYVNGSIPPIATNSNKRKNDATSEDNAQSSKRSRL